MTVGHRAIISNKKGKIGPPNLQPISFVLPAPTPAPPPPPRQGFGDFFFKMKPFVKYLNFIDKIVKHSIAMWTHIPAL
jgi:hypothetical protein